MTFGRNIQKTLEKSFSFHVGLLFSSRCWSW